MGKYLHFTWFLDNAEKYVNFPQQWRCGETGDEISAPGILRKIWMDHPEIFRQHRAYKDFICHRTGPNDEQWLAASGVQKLDLGEKLGRVSRQYINHRK